MRRLINGPGVCFFCSTGCLFGLSVVFPWCLCCFFFGWFESHLSHRKARKHAKKFVGFLAFDRRGWKECWCFVGCFCFSELCWLETVGVYKVAGIGIICSIYSWFVWQQVYLVSWKTSKLSTWFFDVDSVDSCCFYPSPSFTNPTIAEKATIWVNCMFLSNWKGIGMFPLLCQFPGGYHRECWILFIQIFINRKWFIRFFSHPNNFTGKLMMFGQDIEKLNV